MTISLECGDAIFTFEGSQRFYNPIRFSQVTELSIPLFNNTVQAGIPSPANDYLGKAIDLNEHLEMHKVSVFMVKVEDDTFVTHGILGGAMLIVDKAEQPRQL